MKSLKMGVAALVAATALSACGDDLFDVQNPGRILDADLNTERGVQALVVGMSHDFSEGFDGESFLVARLSDEIVGSGSYFSTGRYRRGLMDSEDANGFWGDVQRARWVAEAGLERMRAIEGYQFDGNALTARAFLFAGVANRRFGENFCEVVFSAPYETDTGEAQPKSAAFQRAIPHLQAAVSQGTSSGDMDIVTAAHGALADVHVGLGDWASAMSEAAQVPTDFVYTAFYSNNSGSEENEIWNESHGRYEVSAFMTIADLYGGGVDPRAPFTDCTTASICVNANGADGQTAHYRQEKYPDQGSDIPMVKGTSMRLLEAENALNQGDLAGAMAKINEVRAHHGLAPLTSDGNAGSITYDLNSNSVWDILDREVWMTNWLEGRRLWWLHRQDHPFLNGGGVVYEATVARRASCIPISDQECQVNENVASKCFTV